ncbi:2-dehydropantoate 2-reductase [Vibrio sp.]|nr:2-dehydropantoate 2-reductase [Vibrio sp.]
MNIVIIGPGAIGSLWAYKLSQQHHCISVWARSNDPLYSIQLNEHHRIDVPNQSIQSLIDADIILVTLKAWQIESVLTPLLDSIPNNIPIVLLHNGMGVIDDLLKLDSDHPFILGTTTHGAHRPNQHHVVHAGHGHTLLGYGNPKANHSSALVTSVLDLALSPVKWVDNIEIPLWDKLAINCVINPLTALHQCRNGELSKPYYRQLIALLIEEIVEVMQAEGIMITTSELSNRIYDVIESTAQNLSSMNRDVFFKNTTEIDFITGYLLEKARKNAIKLPHNTELYRKIKLLNST